MYIIGLFVTIQIVMENSLILQKSLHDKKILCV